jgi:hypothetical protein
MAYDETLAARVRRLMVRESDGAERKMFGGLCFTVAGKMCCGVLGRDLVLRIAPERYDTALRAPHVRPMDFTGRPMRGFVYVGPDGTRDARALRKWVSQGVGFARSLADAGVRTRARPKARRPKPFPRDRRPSV